MWKKSIIFMLCMCTAMGSSLSFDILFPMTWYEKSVNALTFVVNRFYEKPLDEDFSHNDCDVLLGKTMFACFCLERMMGNQRAIAAEDILYCKELLSVLENQLTITNEYDVCSDYIECLISMVNGMKQRLQVPSDVNSK